MNYPKNRIQVRIDLANRDNALQFSLDSACWTQDASRCLVLTGWVVHADNPVRLVSLHSAKGEVASAPVQVSRPGVGNAFPEYPQSERSGFRIEVPDLGQGAFGLSALLESGERQMIAELRLFEGSRPKILFVHIPKTAGSSFNTWLSSKFSRGQYAVHVESESRWFSEVEYFRNLDFVAGHLTLAHFEKRLNISDYYCVTVVREPYAQLASHLAWIRKLSDEGEEHRFVNHPEYIQTLSRKLAEVDLAHADQLGNFVRSLKGPQRQLISNCQLRYFAELVGDEEVQEKHLDRAIKASRKFDRIGRTEDMESMVAAISSDLGWPPPGPLQRKNVSSSLYGLDCSQPDIRAALEPLVRIDLQLLEELARCPGAS